MATTYHLYLRKDKQRKNGECPIYMRITQNRQSRYVSTGVTVQPKYWNGEAEQVRKSYPGHKALNNILSQSIQKARNAQATLGEHEKDSAQSIQETLRSRERAEFFSLAEEHLKELKANERYYAVKTANVVLKKIEHFEGERSLPLNKIDVDYLERFEAFLKSEYGNHANTINKNFQTIKAIISIAVKKHLIRIDPFLHFDGAKQGRSKHKEKLTIDEIRTIERLELTRGSSLWHARNYFLFSFYSGGIRFGDTCCLKWENVKNGRLHYVMNKNEKPFSTELEPVQLEILKHYEKEYSEPDDYIFPLLDTTKKLSDPTELRKQIGSKNAMVNSRLKKIAEQAGIDKNLSFHIARHSFAQYAVENGISMYRLMQALRHSKTDTTQTYLKSLDGDIASKVFKELFSTN